MLRRICIVKFLAFPKLFLKLNALGLFKSNSIAIISFFFCLVTSFRFCISCLILTEHFILAAQKVIIKKSA